MAPRHDPGSIARKLSVEPGTAVRVIGLPARFVPEDLVLVDSSRADAVLVFVRTLDELDDRCAAVIAAAKAGRPAWIAYPKAGQLDTDLTRAVLSGYMREKKHVRAVGQVALDAVWSAMRFGLIE